MVRVTAGRDEEGEVDETVRMAKISWRLWIFGVGVRMGGDGDGDGGGLRRWQFKRVQFG